MNRIPLIDSIRGIAIILMVLYHVVFDLENFLGFTHIDSQNGFWLYEGRLSAILFILISGISTSLLFKKYPIHEARSKNLKRALKTLLWALVITGISTFVQRDMAIHFGILHFLATSIVLSTFCLKINPKIIFLSAIIIITITPIAKANLPASNWFLPLGKTAINYSSWDYYPLLPWFAVVLIGLSLGKIIPWHKISIPKMPLLGKIGRHSLAIYLLHQPIIIGTLFLLQKLLNKVIQ